MCCTIHLKALETPRVQSQTGTNIWSSRNLRNLAHVQFLRPCLLLGEMQYQRHSAVSHPTNLPTIFWASKNAWTENRIPFYGVIGGFFRINFPRLFGALITKSAGPSLPSTQFQQIPATSKTIKRAVFPNSLLTIKPPLSHFLKKMVFGVPLPSNSTMQMDLCQAKNSKSIWRRLLYLIHALKGTAESRRPFCFISWRWVKRNPSPSSRWVTDIVLFMRRFYISEVVQMFFFSSTVLLEMFNIISCQKTSNGMTSGRRRWRRLQQMGSHLPLMTSHHNSDIPQLPTWSSKTPTFKNALRCLFGVPRNLNPKHTSIQAPSRIPSAGRLVWAALVIIGGDNTLCKWQSFRSFFPKNFQVGNSNLEQCKE